MLSTQNFQRLAIAVLVSYSLISGVSAAPVDSAGSGALAARELPVAGTSGVLGDGGSPLGGVTDSLPLSTALDLANGLGPGSLLSSLTGGLPVGSLPLREVGLGNAGELPNALGTVTGLAGTTGAVSPLPLVGDKSGGSGNLVGRENLLAALPALPVGAPGVSDLVQ